MSLKYRNSAENLELRFDTVDWFLLLHPPELSDEQEKMIFDFIAKQWDMMPGFVEKIVQLPRIFSQPTTQSVCFYPGSFNPWHQGHQACVELAPVESLIIVPDANPWKSTTRPLRLSSIIDLMKSLPANSYLYPGFINLKVGNPTVDWLPKTKWKNISLSVGADSFINLEKWKDIQVLLESLNSLYVVPRNIADDQLKLAQTKIQSLWPKLDIKILAHHPFENISSTDLRK